MSWLVYLISFSNGKHYVGVTSQGLPVRMSKHKYDAFNKRKKNSNYNYPLYKAIRKYGWENIKFSILHPEVSKETVDALETTTIEKYSSLISNNGYNISLGGVLHKQYSIETKKKMSAWQVGRKMSEAAKQKMAEAKFKPVACYDSTGKLVKVYKGSRDAEKIDGYNHGAITQCVLGKKATHKKLIWKYYKETEV